MRKPTTVFLVVTAVLLIGSTITYSQGDTEIPENVLENEKCFKCHGSNFYYYYNDWIEKDVRERMNPYFVFDSLEFYQSNHKSFLCTDCHSTDYETFPHDGALRMEEKYTCMDCHGGDDDYAKFNFEEIETEFHESVHSSKYDETFTCWMCHNPHSYKLSARDTENLQETIAYDNGICLSCHAHIDKFQLLTVKENANVIQTHDWLPNQIAHFRNVRCLECHAKIDDNLMVAHQIQTKDKAVKRCVECHSQNSLLMASLYKYEASKYMTEAGYFNAAILNEAYVIGANRNYFLNIIS
nr:cytochrome c3 family protein [Bacteroidota bacterium]